MNASLMNTTPPRKSPPLVALRRQARHYAVQAMYQWQLAGASLNQIEAEFRSDYDFKKVDGDYFHELIHEVPAQLDELDSLIAPLLDRNIKELGSVELAVLRLATYELKQRIDVPFKVVINEAVSLDKKFGATDSHKYINGVLDKLAHQLRSTEVNGSKSTDNPNKHL